MHRPQLVRPGSESQRVAGLHLSQLHSQALGKSLHEKIMEGEVFLYLHWEVLQHSVEELAGLPPPHWLHLGNHIKLFIVRELVNVEELGLELLVLVLRGEGVHEVDHLRDHLSREGRQHMVKPLLIILYAA